MNSSIFSDFLNSAWDAEAQFLSTKKGSPYSITEHRSCDLNPARSVPESSTLTTRLPSHSTGVDKTVTSAAACYAAVTELLNYCSQHVCMSVRSCMAGTTPPNLTLLCLLVSGWCLLSHDCQAQGIGRMLIVTKPWSLIVWAIVQPLPIFCPLESSSSGQPWVLQDEKMWSVEPRVRAF